MQEGKKKNTCVSGTQLESLDGLETCYIRDRLGRGWIALGVSHGDIPSSTRLLVCTRMCFHHIELPCSWAWEVPRKRGEPAFLGARRELEPEIGEIR